MRKFFHSRFFYISITFIVIAIVISMAHGVGSRNKDVLVTTTVEKGSVQELVSISGIAKAEQTAELAFPVTGIIEEVHVEIGDEVKTGDQLITLDSRALQADRQDALASLVRAVADRDELLKGPTLSARELTNETLASKEEALQTTKENEARKVANAYSTLLSTDLTAYSLDKDEDAVPPTISGTYTCNKEGTYEIKVFNSSAKSGYSFSLSGLETGTYSVPTDQPTSFGNCDLIIQFDSRSNYSKSNWLIDIPNLKSSQYIINRNAHSLAVTKSESAISLAEQAVSLAKADSINQNAPPRDESIIRANAAVTQAQARLNRIDSTITDMSLTAPFDGTITEIDLLPGETVSLNPVVTLLASGDFEVTARIPEIDIGKILPEQKVEMFFDAKSDEKLTGEVKFISLKSTEIDGVAYYEAVVELNENPSWIRSGLNADIEIIIAEKTDELRLPKRFITQTETGYEVLLLTSDGIASSTIEVLLEGNDGFIAIEGLAAGDVIVAP